jgi:methylthioribose-1-phosphate isomerase
MNRIRATLKNGQAGNDESAAKDLVQKVKDVCGAVHGEDLERCMTMGRLGAEWFWKHKKGGDAKKGLKIVTVCNTGSLATSVSTNSARGKAAKNVAVRATEPLWV